MKASTILSILLSIAFCSCMGRNQEPNVEHKNEELYGYEETYNDPLMENPEAEDMGKTKKEKFFATQQRTPLKTHRFMDARTGLVISTAEYPSDWEVISKPSYTLDQKIPVFLVQVQGPNNLKTFNTPIKVHISYDNPQTYQFMAQSSIAQMHRPLVSNHQIIQEEVRQRMQRSGFQYSSDIKLNKSETYFKQKIAQSGGNVHLDLLATVWESENGQKALVSVGKIAMRQPLSVVDHMTLWLYSVEYVFVDAAAFDTTVEQLENAIVSGKETAQWKQYMAQLNQQRMQESALRHQQNMANRRAAFNAHQQKMQGIWAAQDANHASFMNRSFGAGSSVSQQNFVNMINEEETVYNPLNGKNYQVNAFSTQNWMDSNGNLIQNNDLFYTPNGDINLNNREWVKVKKAY